MAALRKVTVSALFALVFQAHGEIISDLGSIMGPTPTEENRALELKAEKYWQGLLSVAEEMKLAEHLALYDETDKAIAELPAENEYVRQALLEAVVSLRRADEAVLTQGAGSSSLASERLGSPTSGSGFSFFSAGQNFMKKALQQFVSGGHYSERLTEHVAQRQADILPVLRGAAQSTGNVLSDARTASKLAFDVLKYDIYNKGVPKTPQAAKDVANKLVDAAGETRHRFMKFVTEMATGIANDAKGKTQEASFVVAGAQLNPATESRFRMMHTEQVVNL